MAAINPGQRPQAVDPLDTIVKGLTAAHEYYGIKEAGPRADLLQAQIAKENTQNTLAQGQVDLAKSGAISQAQWVDKAPQFKVLGTAQDFQDKGLPAGAMQVKVQGQLDSTPDNPLGIASLIAIPKKNPNEALEAFLKQQEVALHNLQIASETRKAGEVDPARAVAAGYAQRAQQAADTMAQLAQGGYNRAGAGPSAEAAVMNLPGMGMFEGLKSQDSKLQDQAEKNFATAVLRVEAGARMNPEQMKEVEGQYFPRAGDGPDVVAAKRQNMAQTIAALQNEAGMRALAATSTTPFKVGTLNAAPIFGMNSAQAATPAGLAAFLPPAAPKPGSTDGGYTFMGGDPANAKNWVKGGK